MNLVTGATGLLGSHVVVELARTKQKVRALYRTRERIERVWQLFQFYFPQDAPEKWDCVEWFEGNIADLPRMEEAMEHIEYVYHCAALVSFHRRDFNHLVKTNRWGTANMVNLALDKKVKHFCYVSSTAAVGKKTTANTIIRETNKWEENEETSGYALSKHLAEKEVWRGIEEGLNAVIVNPCVMLGAGDWDESSLTLLRTVSKGLRFYTSGANAVVDVRDVASIMLQLVEQNSHNERYLLIGENVPFKTLLEKIALRLNQKVPTIATPRWMGELTWRLSAVLALFSGKKATLTKESVQSAYATCVYSNEKIKAVLPIDFKTVEEAVDTSVRFREFQKRTILFEYAR